MINTFNTLSIAALLLLTSISMTTYAQVTVVEELVTIPTYKIGEPNPMPRYYEGKTHQGVQRRVYPYPMNDALSTNKVDVEYNMIKIENKFIELGIVPELGGRIYYALDKTNNYMWFYKNNVVKPSLIGMVGFWISGSNTWGFPHHHGPNTVKSMDVTLEDHKDGSKTIWVANTDKRHRMRVLVGYTVYPNSSIVEMTIKPQNRTPISNSFLFWANPSVHVDTTYQVIFPPSVNYVTQHAKREMTTWPIADRKYNHFDYTDVDISRWKNIGVPSSFFSWNPQEDYFAGYDHGKQAGTAWIGNHHIMPGMKYWADGNNPAGVRINKGLTDNDGQYIELMAGFYTDNQPDYSWMQPYESKQGKMIWFPIREMGGLKYANKHGALNLELIDGTAKISMNATTPFKDAKAILKSKGEEVYEKMITIGPDKPLNFNVKLPLGTVEDDLEVLLLSSNRSTLLHFIPANHHPPTDMMPDPLQALASPKDIKTNEELYLTGLRLNQFYNASLDPMSYYEEALRRDPGDYRVNTQLGILAVKAMNWKRAETYLQTAVDRITMNYTRPKDGEGLYYLGVSQRALGKRKSAYDNLYRATWSSAWHSAAYYQLAEMDCETGDFEKALNHIDRALSTNALNDNAPTVKAIILRKLNQPQAAKKILQAILAKDKINHWALNEMSLIEKEAATANPASSLTTLNSIMRNEVEAYLELATSYGNCGFAGEARDVLGRLEKTGNTYPMLYYYLGYYCELLKEMDQSRAYYKKAATMPHNYCFPYRAESIGVLECAMKTNPDDAMASYYLGNLLYEHQPNRAISMWEYSRELDASFYIVHRNLGLAYEEVRHDDVMAMQCLEKAVGINAEDPRLLFELDNIYEKNKVDTKKKYNLLKDNKPTARKRTETLLRLATRSVEMGEYEEAIDLIETNTFPQFEGGREMQDAYLNAFTLRAIGYINSKSFELAEADIQTVLDYPVGRFGRSRWAQFNYLMGEIQSQMGQKAKAQEYYQRAIEIQITDKGNDLEYFYYQGLALKASGQKKAAKELFTTTLKQIQDGTGSAFFTQFEGGKSDDYRKATNHYLAGLAFEGMGDVEKAKAEFEKTLTYNPSHVWGKVHLTKIEIQGYE